MDILTAPFLVVKERRDERHRRQTDILHVCIFGRCAHGTHGLLAGLDITNDGAAMNNMLLKAQLNLFIAELFVDGWQPDWVIHLGGVRIRSLPFWRLEISIPGETEEWTLPVPYPDNNALAAVREAVTWRQ